MDKRIADKLDKIESTLVNQEINLARLTVSVEDHVKRSNQFEEALKPVQKHVAMVEGAMKLIALLGLIVTILEAIHRAF